MNQSDLFQITMEYALELILLFDGNGIITYANESARQQLEFGDELCGCSIEDIFPGEFRNIDTQFNHLLGTGIHDMTAYRKNRTCFPSEQSLPIMMELRILMFVWHMILPDCNCYRNRPQKQMRRQRQPLR